MRRQNRSPRRPRTRQASSSSSRRPLRPVIIASRWPPATTGAACPIKYGRCLRPGARSQSRGAVPSKPSPNQCPPPPWPRDADLGEAGIGQWLSGHGPVSRGRPGGRPCRERRRRAQRDGAPLSQSGRPRRRQDAIRRPLVTDDQTRHEPGRVRHARRRDRPGRRERGREGRYAIRLSRGAASFAHRPNRVFYTRRAIVAPSPADPVLDSIQTHRVVPWHTLWGSVKVLRRPRYR